MMMPATVPPLGAAVGALLLAALVGISDADLPTQSQLMQAGSKAFQTSLSTLWRGSDDLRC